MTVSLAQENMKTCILKASDKIETLIDVVVFFAFSYLISKYGYTAGLILSILVFLKCVYLKSNKIFEYIFFLLPLCTMCKFSENSITIIPFIYLIYIFKTLIIEKQKLEFNQLILFLFLILFQLMSICLFKNSLIKIMSMIISFLFMILAQNKNIKIINKAKCSINFIIGICLSTFFAQIFPELPYIISFEKQTILDNIGRFAALNGDPNYYAQLVLIGVAFSFYLIISFKQSLSKKMLLIIASIYLCVSAYYTYSKSFVVGLVFLLFYILISLLKKLYKSDKKIYYTLLFLFLIILIPLLYLFFIYVVLPVFSIRSTSQNGDIFTGRTRLWKIYLEASFNNLYVFLFGSGYNNAFLTNGQAAHNIYLEYLLNFGILGIVLFVIIFQKSFKNIVNNLLNPIVLPFMIFAFTGLALSVSASDILFVLIPFYNHIEKRRKNNYGFIL